MPISVFPERMDKLDPEDVNVSLRTLESYIHYICERTEFAITNTFRTTTGLGSSAESISLVLQDAMDSLSAVSSQLAVAQTDISRLQDDVGGLEDTLSSFEPLLTGQSDGPAEQVVFTAPGEGLPLKACVVGIDLVQSGSGDPSPSNVRSISGWIGAQIHVSPTTTAEDGTTYVVDWSADAGTVYGGTLDVLTGLLTVTHAGRRFSSLTWTKNAAANTFNGEGFTARLATIDGSGETGCFCDAYKWYKSTDPGLRTNHGIALAKTGSLSTRIYVTDLRFTAVDGFTASFESYDPLVVCPLANPMTYQLTPQAVTTLTGANNIWADTGDVTVEHGAYLAALQAEIERLQEGGN